jgi:voltage-gated potassium channel
VTDSDARPSAAVPARPLLRTPDPDRAPLVQLAGRIWLALALMLVVAATVWLGRDGYRDSAGDGISVLDALYYASVSVTTTGYGDITPVSDGARLATVVIVTPARIGFLLLLVGTTVELLTERGRAEARRRRWRRTVQDHHVICGYGVKGRAAARALRDEGVEPRDIVVVEPDPAAGAMATADGLTVVRGDATRTATLREAVIERAAVVIVAADRDDIAVLTTLTARELAPRARIVAAVREEENRHLLVQSGADDAIVTSETAGRLLGVSARNPDTARIVEDLLDTAHGLKLVEHRVDALEAGGAPVDVEGQRPFALLREGRLLRLDEDGALPLRTGDLVVSVAAGGESGENG